jgi:uncharacterized protein YndB with AHSA1/START domain
LEKDVVVDHGSIHIERSPEEVFDYVVDPSTQPDWSIDELHVVRPPKGPIAVGTTYRFAWFSPVLNLPVEVDFEVTAFERPTRLQVVGRARWFQAEATFTFRQNGSGTIVENEARMTRIGDDAPLELRRTTPQYLLERRRAALNLLKKRLESR